MYFNKKSLGKLYRFNDDVSYTQLLWGVGGGEGVPFKQSLGNMSTVKLLLKVDLEPMKVMITCQK